MSSEFTTKKGAVRARLQQGGQVHGYELQLITWRFGAAIKSLRNDGDNIVTTRLSSTDFVYELV